MLDNSLLNSNFVGRDGFRWWVGQIPPEAAHNTQINKNGWGNRMKVRIMGYHPFNEGELSNDDLPWAQILLPTTVGSGAGNYAADSKVQPGDTVFGFFLDGDNSQLPVIMGVFGRTSEVSTEQYSSPFVPFTGYTTKIANDGSHLKADQTNEKTEESQKSPYYLPPKQANSMNEISYFSGVGDVVHFSSSTSDSFIHKITTEIQNVLKFIENIKSFPGLAADFIEAQIKNLIYEVSLKIQGIVGGIVNGAINSLYNKITPVLSKGVSKLYEQTYNVMFSATQSIRQAHLAGVASQTAIIPAVQCFQNSFCGLFNLVFEALKDIIAQMLASLVKSVVDFASCVVDQFVGGLFNKIIGSITNIVEPILQPLSTILELVGGFNLQDILKGDFNVLSGIGFKMTCGEKHNNTEAKQWIIGSGVKIPDAVDLNNILNISNIASEISKDPLAVVNQILGTTGNTIDALGNVISPVGEVIGLYKDIVGVSQELLQNTGSLDIYTKQISNPNFKSSLSSCYAGPQLFKTPPKIKVSTSSTNDPAVISPVYGSIDGDTASIIGAIVEHGGSGYENYPMIQVESKDGYGAVIHPIMKDGSVVSAYVVCDGVGYPYKIQNQSQTQTQPQIQNQNNVTIVDVAIINSGVGYETTDIVYDNLGNKYNAKIINGSITKVTPVNIVSISDLPKIYVANSQFEPSNGSGAILKPIFGRISTTDTTQATNINRAGVQINTNKEVQKVVDCIIK